MATTTRANMVSNVQLYIMDVSSTAATFTSTQLTTFINMALLWWYENYEKRIKYATLIAAWPDTLGAAYESDGDTSCLYPEILEIYRRTTSLNAEASGSEAEDTPLIKMDWNELRARQASLTAVAAATHYAILKYGAAAVSASAQNKWKFALYPVPAQGSAYKITGLVRDYPVQLSADADIVDLGEYEARCVEIIAAILASRRKGKPELGEDLMQLLPKLIQDKLATHQSRDEVKA